MITRVENVVKLVVEITRMENDMPSATYPHITAVFIALFLLWTVTYLGLGLRPSHGQHHINGEALQDTSTRLHFPALDGWQPDAWATDPHYEVSYGLMDDTEVFRILEEHSTVLVELPDSPLKAAVLVFEAEMQMLTSSLERM
jgi:hypothetical protein